MGKRKTESCQATLCYQPSLQLSINSPFREENSILAYLDNLSGLSVLKRSGIPSHCIMRIKNWDKWNTFKYKWHGFLFLVTFSLVLFRVATQLVELWISAIKLSPAMWELPSNKLKSECVLEGRQEWNGRNFFSKLGILVLYTAFFVVVVGLFVLLMLFNRKIG